MVLILTFSTLNLVGIWVLSITVRIELKIWWVYFGAVNEYYYVISLLS